LNEEIIIEDLLEKNLIKTEPKVLSNENIIWGNGNKNILLISKSTSVENDSSLIKKVISLTENFSEPDFYFLQYPSAFSLIETIRGLNAEKVFVFGFSPIECAIFHHQSAEQIFNISHTEICFFREINFSVADANYKKIFAAIWLKMLQTKWIQK
jgi:hypothetical protein